MRKRIGLDRMLVASALVAGALLPALGGCGDEDQGNAAGDPSNADAGNGFNSNGDSGGGTGLNKCATESKKAEVRPVDLMIGLDTSFSMDFDRKWISVQAALKSFVQNPGLGGLGVGVQYFPLRKQCSVTDYATPAVPITALPQGAQPVSQSLDGQQMFGGTPIVPVLQGLSQYMKTYSAQHPERKPVVVLATDGIPDDTCRGTLNGSTPNTIENAVTIAKSIATGSPPVSVFVIGVGTELKALNDIGQAGGTGNAILVDTTKDVEKAFLDALSAIRKTAIPCDYDIPSLGSAPDPNKINVNFVRPSGEELFLYVGSAADCTKSPDKGWYFDDANAPKKVILCPATCEKAKAADDGKIDVVFGCDRISIR